MGEWLDSFVRLDRQDYLERLEKYRDCMLREMAYKLDKSRELDSCRQQLAALKDQIPFDSSGLSRRRDELLRLIPLLKEELEPAARQSIDAAG
jgi:hypothetical protein